LLLPKLVLSSRVAAYPTGWSGEIALVVPVYNEDPELFQRVLRSIEMQTMPPASVWIIDDASSSSSAGDAAERWARAPHPFSVHVVRRMQNAGKRRAQAVAFRVRGADVFVTIDSDTVVAADAIEQLVAPFANDDVQAVTGHVRALNWRASLLSRLIDVRYANAFLWERAAYSSLGSVLCCCGSLAAYRSSLIGEHLDDFLAQTFLGVPSEYGDDRRLTNYALLGGAVVFQPTARAWTAVPDRLGHFVRQQIRWNKSFFREALWASRHLPARRPAAWLAALELASWLGFSAVLVLAVIHGLAAGSGAALLMLLVTLTVMSLIRSSYFLDDESLAWRDRIVGYALSPVYGLLHLCVLLPLRLWALATLRNGHWGTRAQVEVNV
jgi:hyaluronan synthase